MFGHNICKILIIIFLVTINCCHIKQEELSASYKKALIKSNIDIDNIKSFLDNNKRIDFKNKKCYLDTICFESQGKYFLQTTFPFEELKNGHFLIADTRKSNLYLFSENGKYLKTISRIGQGEGEYMKISDIAKNDQNIFVTDGMQRKILIYDYEGRFVKELKKAYNHGPTDFKVSPVSYNYVYYHIFPYPNSPTLTIGNFEKGIIKTAGKMDKINKIATFTSVKGISINEKGYIFVIKPMEYGYDIYGIDGKLKVSIAPEYPHFFNAVSKNILRKINFDNSSEVMEVCMNSIKAKSIYYLGDNIIVIQYLKHYIIGSNNNVTMKDWYTQIENIYAKIHLDFWRVDGEHLGSIETDSRSIFRNGENGYLYFWSVNDINDIKDSSGFYQNPCLIKYDIWKEIGIRVEKGGK